MTKFQTRNGIKNDLFGICSFRPLVLLSWDCGGFEAIYCEVFRWLSSIFTGFDGFGKDF